MTCADVDVVELGSVVVAVGVQLAIDVQDSFASPYTVQIRQSDVTVA